VRGEPSYARDSCADRARRRPGGDQANDLAAGGGGCRGGRRRRAGWRARRDASARGAARRREPDRSANAGVRRGAVARRCVRGELAAGAACGARRSGADAESGIAERAKVGHGGAPSGITFDTPARGERSHVARVAARRGLLARACRRMRRRHRDAAGFVEHARHSASEPERAGLDTVRRRSAAVGGVRGGDGNHVGERCIARAAAGSDRRYGRRVGGAAHDAFFVTTTYGKTLAIDASDGSVLWRFTPASYASVAGSARVTTATPVADPDRTHIYAASPDGDIQKLNVSDGSAVWSTAITTLPAREKIASSLNLFRGKVLATTGGYI